MSELFDKAFSGEDKTVLVDAKDAGILVLEVDGKQDVIDIKKFLSVEDSEVPKAFAENPSLYAYYASVHVWYEFLYDKLMYDLSIERAERDKTIRRKYSQMGDKPREGDIHNEVALDPVVQKMEKQVLRAKYVCKKLQILVRGLERRGDKLVQRYAAYRRDEERRQV